MAKINQFDSKKMYMESHTKKIKDVVTKVTSDYMYIAFLLWEIKEYQYYEESYKDTVEYAEKELDMSKSTCNRYIQLCEMFSKRTKSDCPSMHVAEVYKDYSISKMLEILSLKPEQRCKVTNEMTIKDIKDLKKKIKEENKKGATSRQENVLTLRVTELNELRCENCGKSYFVDASSKKQWIILNGKAIGSCCFEIKYDTDLYKKSENAEV